MCHPFISLKNLTALTNWLSQKMNNDTTNANIIIAKLFERWGLSDAQKSEVLQISDISDLIFLLASQLSAGDNSLSFRIEKLLEIHAQLRGLFPGNIDLVYAWMTPKNKEFG